MARQRKRRRRVTEQRAQALSKARSAPTLYRIVDLHPYLDREEEYGDLTLDEAATRMEDLTGVGADTILADFDEDCTNCEGCGRLLTTRAGGNPATYDCPACLGAGKRREPWEWVDDETGREVTLRRNRVSR